MQPPVPPSVLEVVGKVDVQSETFMDVWLKSLARSAVGLDFDRDQDRATFRERVASSMRALRWDGGMNTIASYLACKPPRSRFRTARQIADAWIHIVRSNPEHDAAA